MEKITELHILLKSIYNLVEQNKEKIEQILCDIEDDGEIPDEEWDIIDDVGSSIQLFCTTFEELEEQIGESK